jgi:hypothetical protein
MGEAVLILTNPHTRAVARQWIDRAPDFTRLTFKDSKRTLPQNDKMWAMLTDIARQKTWPLEGGTKRSTKVWKDLFSAATLAADGGLEVVPGLEGGIMLVGLRTSEMTVDQMASMISYMDAWGAQNGVTFTDPVPLSPPRDGAQGKPASGGGRG